MTGFGALIADAFRVFRGRLVLLLTAMVSAGLTEGLALLAVLPLLGDVGVGSGGLGATIARVPGALGLPDGPVGSGLLMLGLIMVSALAFIAQAQLATAMQARYAAHWQRRVFSACLGADPRFLAERRGGDVVAALTVDANRVSGAFYNACILAAASVHLIASLVIALILSPPVTLLLIAVAGILFLATRVFMRRAYALGDGITRGTAEVQSLAGEFVAHAKLVKATAAEAAAGARFARGVDDLADLYRRNSFDVQKSRAVFEFGGGAALALVLIAGPLTLGVDVATILVVVALFVRLLPRMTGVQQSLQALSSLLPSFETLRRLVTEAEARAEPADGGPLPADIRRGAAPIHLRSVTVRFGARTVLDRIDLDLPARGVVALVGPSGSGKSTLVDALLGLVPLAEGRIAIAGHDLAGLALPAWRKAVGYAGQETMLFADTLAANVAFGNQASPAAIDRALELAAVDFIGRLPAGVETPLGDRGTGLSGGERQRLGVARAIAVERIAYVLDEATSALDAETELRVMRAAAVLGRDALVIVVAHRFSAIRSADVVHLVDGGRIVESGSWASLDVPGTRFRKLRDLQIAERGDAAA